MARTRHRALAGTSATCNPVNFSGSSIFGGHRRRVDPCQSAGRCPLRRLSFCPIGDRAWIDDHVPVADPCVRWTHPWHYPSIGECTVIHIRESSLNRRHPAAVRSPRGVAVHKIRCGPLLRDAVSLAGAKLGVLPAERLAKMLLRELAFEGNEKSRISQGPLNGAQRAL